MSEHIPEAGTMLRGSKMRIYPSPHQSALMDLWRRRCIQLWNLLLDLEQAAYSGAPSKAHLGWRSIWARVMEESHAEAVRVAAQGKQRKDGSYRVEPGERNAPPPLDEAMLAKIRRQAVETDPETGEAAPAKLFLWVHELQKIMARLKQVPHTRWIDDLPSHAAQSVVKDLIKALQGMLRERKKRNSGAGGRDTGFPRFKKNRYAAGSVYFANTQIAVRTKLAPGRDDRASENALVKLPNGVGSMRVMLPRSIATALHFGEARLMGGRIWRQGEDWYLSCQWEVPKPEPLPRTGRVAGVKIAAGIPITTYDDRGQTREYAMPPLDKLLRERHEAAGRAQSRALEARKGRVKKREAYAKKRQAQKAERGLAVKPLGRARMPLSRGFYQAAATLAKLEGIDCAMRDGWLHETTTAIVRQFDVIAVQKMQVAKMMKRPEAVEEGPEEDVKRDRAKRRSLKATRVMMRRTAMARIQMTLAYKARDLRGADAYEEIAAQDVTAGACSGCGVLHPEWKWARAKGQQIMRCQEQLVDGKACNTALPYTRNSARLIARELKARLEQRKEPD
jgi:transposase